MRFMTIFVLLFAYSYQVISRPPLVFIEGNIGVGKSTFVKILQRHLGSRLLLDGSDDARTGRPVVLSLEPCDEWQNIEGHNLLEAFYSNPARWALLFQIYASMTRIRRQQDECTYAQDLHIMERSWFSDRYCFAQMLHEGGKINELEWAVYEQMWDWYMRNSDLPVCFIYLRASPEECYDRLKNRNRSEEASVPLSYLQDLHDHHERLLIDKTAADSLRRVPVLVLDGSLNFRDSLEIQQIFIAQILDFLKIHGNIDLTV